MTEIYLIRHAQAEGNLYRMMQGHWDGDVTELGRRQIDALAERMKDQPLDALYSSDLYRTRLTASAITRYHDIPVQLSQKLREINMGPWETRFFADVIHEDPASMERFIFSPDTWRVEGAETYADVTARAYPFLESIAREHDGQRVAVVSHGVTIRCLLSKALGIDLRDTEALPICRNTAISKLIWDGEKFTAEYINDFAHIVPLGSSPWNSTEDLRGEVFDPAGDREWYESCYADAWRAAHGSLNGFTPELYSAAAIDHHRRYNGAVLRICSGDEPVGLVDLDTAKGEGAGYGWISLIYLVPEYRGKGYGIQLLARAMTAYAALGRKSLRLTVAKENAAALAFYKSHGFETLSTQAGGLLLMEKKLGRQEP